MKPERSQLKEKLSVVSAWFGKEQMELAEGGLLNRPSLEEGYLSGEGEDTSLSCKLLRMSDLTSVHAHLLIFRHYSNAL